MEVICPECEAILLTVPDSNVSGSVSHCGNALFFSNSKVWIESYTPSLVASDMSLSLRDREAALRRMIGHLNRKAQEATSYLSVSREAKQLLAGLEDQYEKAVLAQKNLKKIKKPAPSKELKLWVKQCQLFAKILYSQGRLPLEPGESLDDRISAMRSVKKCARFAKKYVPGGEIPKCAHPFTKLRT